MNLIKLISIVLFLVVQAKLSHAGPIGVGAVIGSPSGLTGKMWLNSTRAVDTTLAWNTSGYTGVHLQMDYLVYKLGQFKTAHYPIDLFYGAGGRISSYDSKKRNGFGAGLRAPLGLSYQFQDPKVEIFGEVAAVLEFIPNTDVIFNIAFGGRYFF